MSEGLQITSLEFMDDDAVSFTWVDDEDFGDHHGEVRKAWIDMKQLPDWLGEKLTSAAEELLEEYLVWKRNPPASIEPD